MVTTIRTQPIKRAHKDTFAIQPEHERILRAVYNYRFLTAEQLLEAHVRSGDLCGVIIHLFNVYRPGQRNDFVLSRFLQLAMQG